MERSTYKLQSNDYNRIRTARAHRLNPVRLTWRVLENFLIVYFDEYLNEDDEHFQNMLMKLHGKVNEIVLFNNMDIFLQFMNQLNSEKAIVIISGFLAKNLLPRIHFLPQIYAIHLIDDNLIYDKQWSKVKGIYTSVESIFESLSKIVRQDNENNVSITFASMDESESNSNQNRLESSFMYTQLFKKFLLEMKHDQQSFDNFIAYYRKEYEDNPSNLKFIAEFEQTYCPNKAIWWYTRPTFIYQVVNRALRLLEGDIIINMGFFIHDLHYQIKQHHNEQIYQCVDKFPCLYRGQGISLTDFEKLKKNKGQLMSFNCFLSTSKDRAISFNFAMKNSTRKGMVGILFVITIDPKLNSTPFANIEKESYYQNEAEILFSMHSVFRTGDIKCLDERQRLYEVQLTLTTDDDPELRELFNQMAMELSDCTGEERLRRLLMRIGQDDKAEKLYLDLLAQSESLAEKMNCYYRLGWINKDRGNYKKALEYYREALSILTNTGCSKNNRTFGYLYDGIGSLYSDTGDYSNALIYHERSLDIHKELCSPDDSDSAHCYNNLGMVYYQMGEYNKALFNFDQAFVILKKVLAPNHTFLAQIQLNIGTCYSKMQDYTKALISSKMAFDILEKVLPENHPSLANAHNNVGLSYSNNGNFEKALFHYQKSLHIHEKMALSIILFFAPTYVNISEIYSNQYDYSKALYYLSKAHDIFQQILPEDHSTLAMVYSSIGAVHVEQKDYASASSYYEKALRIFQNSLPDDHPDLATGYSNLGVVYYEMKKYQEALHYLKKALTIIKKHLDDNHPSLADVYTKIGFIYNNMEDYEISIIYLQKALDIHRNSGLPPDTQLRVLLDQIEAYKQTM